MTMKPLKQILSELANVNDNPNFSNWFANSLVVDTQGKPLPVYHGCAYPEGFEGKAVFSKKYKDDVGNDWGDALLGHFFTSSSKVANAFASTGGMNMQVYLQILNPYPISGDRFYRMLESWQTKDFRQLRRSVIADGHDGIIIGEKPDLYAKDEGWIQFIAPTYIVFKSNQIKSATGNNGDYNPRSQDITR
jgi:hypothetical protein